MRGLDTLVAKMIHKLPAEAQVIWDFAGQGNQTRAASGSESDREGLMWKFYTVEWWDRDLGPMRGHFASKVEAMKFVRRIIRNDRAEMGVRIDLHELERAPTKATVLVMLDNASNLGSEGLTGYPGKCTTVFDSLADGAAPRS